MASWHLAPSLKKLQADLDAEFGEKRPADGTVGDASHAARSSEHNPDNDADSMPKGAVSAIDVYTTANGKTWISASEFAKLLDAFKKDSRVWYVIHKGYIYSRTYDFAKRKYTGSNPHTNHIHLSLRQTKAAHDDTSSWGLSGVKPDPKPSTGGKYTVRSGDTLSSIADKFGVTVDELVEVNKIKNPDVISVGQVLVLDADDKPVTPPKPPTGGSKKLPTLKKGDKHEVLVPFLKRFFYGPTKSPNYDRTFGSGTRSKVIAYQAKQGLKVDGIVGPQTWAKIASGGTKLPEGFRL